MKFSVGYNNDIDGFIKLIDEYKENISSVYFAPPDSIASSLREKKHDEKKHEKDIIKLIGFCKKYNIKSILLFNATSEGENTGSIKNMLKKIAYMKKMHEIGLTSVSVYNMLHVQFIKKALPELEIYSSVNCHVKEIEMARYMKNLGVDIITIPEEKNRDFKFIADLKTKIGVKIQVMLNEGCIRNCPFRDIHCDISSNGGEFDDTGDNFNPDGLIPSFHCVGMFKQNKKLIFRSCFIRPEDVGFYEDKVDYFKIVSRDFKTEKIEEVLNSYINKKYIGNLFDIVDFPVDPQGKSINYIDNNRLTERNFFEKIQKCQSDCDICNICEEFLTDGYIVLKNKKN